MASEFLQTYVSGPILIANDALTLSFLALLSLQHWHNERRFSPIATTVICALFEHFQTWVIYMQPASGALMFALSGAMQATSQVLMVLGKLQDHEKAQNNIAEKDPKDTKDTTSDAESQQTTGAKVGKWAARFTSILPMYFVGYLNAAALYFYEPIPLDGSITGWFGADVSLIALVFASFVSSFVCCYMATRIVQRVSVDKLRIRYATHVQHVALLISMRALFRWAMQRWMVQHMTVLPEASMAMEAWYALNGRMPWR